MKKSFFLFAFLLSAFFANSSLLATDEKDYVKYSWTKDEKNLYLSLTIDQQLGFANQYQQLKINKGLGCQVKCQPLTEDVITHPEEGSLKEVIITIYLTNLNNEINYELKVDNVYQSGITYWTKNKGTLNISKFNLNKFPGFFELSDKPYQGYIQFEI